MFKFNNKDTRISKVNDKVNNKDTVDVVLVSLLLIFASGFIVAFDQLFAGWGYCLLF